MAPKTFDRRIVPDFVLDFVRACQRRIPCHLGGGAALAGVYLGHRMTGDADLFVHDAEEVDVVHEPIADIAAPPPAEEIVVESLTDLRANKLTCILSRSEPRDLVDLYFLDQAGFPPERDLELALRKDAGVDPAVLAWLLAQFPTRPLPAMLIPLSSEELEKFRDELADRFRHGAVESES